MQGPVETHDVQSLVFSGHGKLTAATVLLLRVTAPAAARAALLRVVEEAVSFDLGQGRRSGAVQLALTAGGLATLGLPAASLEQLQRPFRRGIATPHRSRVLGDEGANDPSSWQWRDAGGDALLLVYADSDATAAARCHELLAQLAGGWSCVWQTTTSWLGGREHFGFQDGLSNPRVALGKKPDPQADELVPGEIVLGYPDGAGIVTGGDFGRNGSYLVLRQLEQDVQSFWAAWRELAGNDDTAAVWLAAKAMGRWPNGMLVSGAGPQPEPPADRQSARRLSFAADPQGDGCPLGAHIRRANPRDGLGDDPRRSLQVVNRHRLLRRGRTYGPHAPLAWYPSSLAAQLPPAGNETATQPRGILFSCLCADLERQFEFTQQTWLNNAKFAGLYDEVDPIAAGHNLPEDAARFSIPRESLRLRLNNVRRWVQVRGGGYFFLPGRRALLGLLGEG